MLEFRQLFNELTRISEVSEQNVSDGREPYYSVLSNEVDFGAEFAEDIDSYIEVLKGLSRNLKAMKEAWETDNPEVFQRSMRNAYSAVEEIVM